jgi:hypothetical protein
LRFIFSVWLQATLYEKLRNLSAKEAKFPPHSDSKTMASVMSYWKRNGNFLQPWDVAAPVTSTRSSPVRCSKTDSVFSPVY